MQPDVLAGAALTGVGLQQDLRLGQDLVRARLGGVGQGQQLLQPGLQLRPVRLAEGLPRVLRHKPVSPVCCWRFAALQRIFTCTARLRNCPASAARRVTSMAAPCRSPAVLGGPGALRQPFGFAV